MSELISRRDAKAAGLKHYFTGKHCKHGHVAERYTGNGSCVPCMTAHTARWAEDNRDRMRVFCSRWRRENPEKVKTANDARDKELMRQRARAYKQRHPGLAAVQGKKFREANPGYTSQYVKRHAARHLAACRAYQLRKFDQVPASADQQCIQTYYTLASLMTKLTGEQHHVDHIIPLSKGGPHHQRNLQVLTATENLRKGASLQ